MHPIKASLHTEGFVFLFFVVQILQLDLICHLIMVVVLSVITVVVPFWYFAITVIIDNSNKAAIYAQPCTTKMSPVYSGTLIGCISEI